MAEKHKIKVEKLNLFYGDNQALHNVELDIKSNNIVALIGPSGCGKSTFLRTLNRMNDLIDIVRINGSIYVDGQDIYGSDTDVVSLRKK